MFLKLVFLFRIEIRGYVIFKEVLVFFRVV